MDFSPGGCSAGHWNGSSDDGGAWRSGVRLETDTGKFGRTGLRGLAGYAHLAVAPMHEALSAMTTEELEPLFS